MIKSVPCMRAISLFSGAGGFEIGFDRAGIVTMLQVEIDPWCREVLTRHWPNTERIVDVRDVDSALLQQRGDDERWRSSGSIRNGHGAVAGLNGWVRDASGWNVDLVYGGFPCQDVSVAGNRAGFRGERSGLWFEFHRVLSELRPRWTVIENVPGLLSSNGGADFGVLLRGLGELGYGWSYRVLDGRHFGVPQRRRRVFVVGCLGDAQRAAQVLAVCESCSGDPAPRSEARERVAASTTNGTHVAGTIGTARRGYDAEEAWTDRLITQPEARAVRARASGYRMDGETENFLVANAVRASDGHHGHSSPRGDGADNLLSAQHGVRRLTPLECERLMGWPDEHTRWTADGREIPDSHRYRLCGNGVISTVAEWIGHRLVSVNRR